MSTSMRTAFILLLSLAGCDPAPPPAPRLEVRNTNPSGDRGGLSSCLEDCSKQKLSETDAFTCRNNCETAFKVTPTAAGDTLLDDAAKCMDGCHGAKIGEHGRCISDCKTPAASAETSWPGALDRLEKCVDSCRADASLSATDRHTCLRNCSQTAKFADAPTS